MADARRPGEVLAGYQTYQTADAAAVTDTDGAALRVPVYRKTASTAENVSNAKPKIGGAVSVASVGARLPDSASAKLDAAFICLGYVSEDGLVNNEAADADGIHAWGGDTALVLQESRSDSYSMTFLEVLDTNVMRFVRGGGHVAESEAGAVSVAVGRADVTEYAVVVDMLFRGRAVRHVIPRGVITERGETTYSDGDAVGYEVTVTALPDASGRTHYEYTAAP